MFFFSSFLISFISFLISFFLIFGRNPLIGPSSWFYSQIKAFKYSLFYSCFVYWSSIVLICFSKTLPSREYVNVVCPPILLWSDGHVSSPVKNSYLSIILDDKCWYFCCLISYCSLSSLISSSIAWLVFIFFIKDSSWNMKNYLMHK